MIRKIRRHFCLLATLLLLASAAYAADTQDMDLTFTKRELSGEWDEGNMIELTPDSAVDGVIAISKEGVYRLSGTYPNLAVHIAAPDSAKVQLVLDNASITREDGPALFIQEADKVFITLPKGSASSLTDGAAYSETALADGQDAAIFSRADLVINGSGKLAVHGQHAHGIVSRDDLIICNAEVEVTTVSTGLEGRDCVMLNAASLTVNAGTNGLRSDLTDNPARGFIYAVGSKLTITSGGDGLEAENALILQDCSVSITAGGGSVETLSTRTERQGWGWFSPASVGEDDNTVSSKGLKAGNAIQLSGGTVSISSLDDCIHANGDITISSGTYTLASGDDGVHADNNLNISGGTITVTQSFEGLEATNIAISGGEISITASDDGLNAAGGSDGSSMNRPFGRGAFSGSTGTITISGGYIFINASGDGIDSNADITISGGVTLVSGTVSSANAAFDYDGSATLTGGVLVATGAVGMAQSFTDAQQQGACLVSINRAVQSTSIAILDQNKRLLVAFTPPNPYQSILVTTPEMQLNGVYTFVIGGTAEGADANGYARLTSLSGGTELGSITMDTLLFGGSGGMQGPGGMRGPGGMPQGPGRGPGNGRPGR